MFFQRPNHGDDSHNNEYVVFIKLEFLVLYIIKELVFDREKYSLLIDIYQSN